MLRKQHLENKQYPMRRYDREITDKNEILEIMSRCDVCRLAFNDGDYPYILPLNFGIGEKEGKIVDRKSVV